MSEFSELSIVKREERRGEGATWVQTPGPDTRTPGVSGAWWRQQDQATQISLCSLMVNILSCGLAWPERHRENCFIHQDYVEFNVCFFLPDDDGDTEVNTLLDTE